jgi:formiminoglutamase
VSLPVLISVPHGGLEIPDEVRDRCVLTAAQVAEDGDEGAAEIYAVERDVRAFVATDIARAVVDLNRAEDDRRADGVVKTHTCLDVPVYDRPLEESVVQSLLERHYRPYHARLRALAGEVALGIDCHTMLAVGPAIGPLAGQERPAACLSNVDGTSCPDDWLERLADRLSESLGVHVARNFPFKGGHIVRTHAAELPWMQLELSRAPFLELAEKRRRTLAAIEKFCHEAL